MHMLRANKLGALGAVIAGRTEAALAGHSPSAAALLSMLHFKPGLTTTELARIGGVTQPTAVRLIDGLERQGLVARGEPDGRVTPLAVTEAGHREVARMQEARLSALGDLLEVLSPAQASRFEKMLDRILAGATTSRAGARTTCRLCEHDVCGPDCCPVGRRAAAIEAEESRR